MKKVAPQIQYCPVIAVGDAGDPSGGESSPSVDPLRRGEKAAVQRVQNNKQKERTFAQSRSGNKRFMVVAPEVPPEWQP